MKKILLVLTFLFVGITATEAQIAYGVKGGLNYQMPKLSKEAAQLFDVSDEMGFNIGAFVRVKVPILGIYVQAEPTYTKLNTTFSVDNLLDSKIGVNRFDLPVLAGLKMLGLFRVYAGPVFTWNIGNQFDEQVIDIVSEEKAGVGAQAGVGVELGPIMVDARYEFGVKNNQLVKFSGVTLPDANFDTRANQLILGVAWKF